MNRVIILCLIVMWVALALFWEPARDSLGAVGAAGVAGIAALAVNETVDQRKRREMEGKIREKREKSYKEVIDHVLSSFGQGSRLDEHTVRRDIALWGSKEFIGSYDEWREKINPYSNLGSVDIDDDLRPELHRAVGQICLSARKDLHIHSKNDPTDEDIAKMIFDDYGK